MDDIWSGEPGLVLDGKYRIDALLGQGGMGAVYRATHLGTTRTVALEVIHPRFSQDREFVERFRRDLFRLLNIVVTPLTAIMTAQLYLKARHAGGEAIDTP